MIETTDRQRIDKWLWFARVVKTRPLAQDLAQSGRVRLNGRKLDAAATPVRVGDVLTIGLGQHVRVLRVLGFAPRRGSYPEARKLYDDLSPGAGRDVPEADVPGDDEPVATASPPSAPPVPAHGDGRPTKRDRRRMERIDDVG